MGLWKKIKKKKRDENYSCSSCCDLPVYSAGDCSDQKPGMNFPLKEYFNERQLIKDRLEFGATEKLLIAHLESWTIINLN